MRFSKLIGTGSYLPEKVVTNHDLEKTVDTSSEWILTRTGINTRYIASDKETPAYMAEQAAKKALEAATIDAATIDAIIVATTTPENFFPSTACLLQNKINAGTCMAFDISAACSGFVYALNVIDQYIRSGAIKRALVVGSEAMSRIVDWQDRSTCVLFGDGAGAALLEVANEPGILGSKIYADGSQKDILIAGTGLYNQNEADPKLTMQGKKLFKIAVEKLIDTVKEILAANNMDISEVDWLVPHQANARIIDLVASKLKIPDDKIIKTLSEHANTSSASIPLALDCGIRKGLIKSGQNILLEAFGGGLTWGSLILKY